MTSAIIIIEAKKKKKKKKMNVGLQERIGAIAGKDLGKLLLFTQVAELSVLSLHSYEWL